MRDGKYSIITKVIPCKEVTKKWQAVDEHYDCHQSHKLVQFNKIPRDLNIFDSNAVRFCPSHLAPKVSKVRSKDLVSVVNILHSNRAIGHQLFTYHTCEFPLSWVSHLSL